MFTLKKTAVYSLLGTVVFLCFSFWQKESDSKADIPIDLTSSMLRDRIQVPVNYKRLECSDTSFGAWARKLQLLPEGSKVKLYNGEPKSRQDVHEAIIDMDCGTKNLQQCADAVIRLRAEYLFNRKKTKDIAFHYTSGDLIPFSRWQKGERPVVTGNKVIWKKTGSTCSDYNCLKNYLWNVYNYAGTLSVQKETKPVSDIHQIQPGDIFVIGGSPGHAVTVIDVAIHEKTGKKIFLLCQSYMPAQQIHILKNFTDPSLSPWYSENFSETLETPEWDFYKNSLRRY